jgi:hypothetical protein
VHSALKPHIVIAYNKPEKNRLLAEAIRVEGISVRNCAFNDYLHLPEVDAIFLSVTHAEKWLRGPIKYKVQVASPGPEDPDMPRFVFSGLALSLDDDDLFSLRLICSLLFEEVRIQNEEGAEIEVMAIWAQWLMIETISPQTLAGILIRSYENVFQVRLMPLRGESSK